MGSLGVPVVRSAWNALLFCYDKHQEVLKSKLRMFFVALVGFFFTISFVDSVFKGAFILPHGKFFISCLA